MADLKTFARRIRALARRVEDNVDDLVRRTAVAVDQTVVIATPVDKGQARGGWQANNGSPITEEIDRLDKSGQETIDENNRVIARRRRGQDIYISNNVGHIGFLNDGSSSQAPENFVEIAAAEGARVARSTRVVR